MTQRHINAGTQERGSERRSPFSFAAPSLSRTFARLHEENRQLQRQTSFYKGRFCETVSVEICLRKFRTSSGSVKLYAFFCIKEKQRDGHPSQQLLRKSVAIEKHVRYMCLHTHYTMLLRIACNF